MDKEAVHFVITGGTIDSFYDGTKDTAVPNKESIIPSFIKSLKLYVDTEFTVVCMKDSRQISQDDLNNVLSAIEQSAHSKVIITHGTYTMPDTARFLKAKLKRDDQVIILTASIIPIQGFAPSDGPFNLGYALGKIQDLDPGIYVAINGRIFDPDEVLKIIGEGVFISIFNN